MKKICNKEICENNHKKKCKGKNKLLYIVLNMEELLSILVITIYFKILNSIKLINCLL